MKRDRLLQICSYIEERGSVSTLELTSHFQVSEMTIRRDLAVLEQQGKITRFHGGAACKKNDRREATFELRTDTNHELKAAIGACGIRFLQEYIARNQPYSIFLGSGTTLYRMAELVDTEYPVSILTDNLHSATILASSGKNKVIMIGGELTLPSLNATGHMAEKELSELTIDCAFIGSSAIDERGTLYAYNMQEAGMFTSIIAVSKHIVVMTDHTKLGKRNLVSIASLNQQFTLITDSSAPADYLQCYRNLGAQVICAQAAAAAESV